MGVGERRRLVRILEGKKRNTIPQVKEGGTLSIRNSLLTGKKGEGTRRLWKEGEGSPYRAGTNGCRMGKSIGKKGRVRGKEGKKGRCSISAKKEGAIYIERKGDGNAEGRKKGVQRYRGESVAKKEPVARKKRNGTRWKEGDRKRLTQSE